jgi:hypothetical protein
VKYLIHCTEVFICLFCQAPFLQDAVLGAIGNTLLFSSGLQCGREETTSASSSGIMRQGVVRWHEITQKEFLNEFQRKEKSFLSDIFKEGFLGAAPFELDLETWEKVVEVEGILE